MTPKSHSVALKAGPVSAVFQEGSVHTITVNGVEVWREVMFLFRDAQWGTPNHQVRNLRVVQHEDSFHVFFEGNCEGSKALNWTTEIVGTENGEIHFLVRVSVVSDVMTSRTGLCVLHPLTAAGRQLEIGHADGRISRSQFPTLVSPWQPFTQIQSLRHEFAPGCWADCRMQGDIFEMEDQRNFSDASFKTYSRSNFMPRPYRLAAREHFHQSVFLTIEKLPTEMPSPGGVSVTVAVTGAVLGQLPVLGLLATATPATAAVLPHYWHVVIDFQGSDVTSATGWAALEHVPAGSHVPLRVSLSVDGDDCVLPVCKALDSLLHSRDLSLQALAIYPTTARSLRLAGMVFPNARIGGGTPSFFTQLNRMALPAAMEFVSFTTCPIVHLADDRSVMQSLETLPFLISTLRARGCHAPLQIGPVGIGMAVDPFGAQVKASPLKPIAMAKFDKRDGEDFGSAWVLAYIAAMSAFQVEAVTIASEHSFAALGDLVSRGKSKLLETTNSCPQKIAALSLLISGGTETWIANLTGSQLSLQFQKGESPAEELFLAPYGLTCIKKLEKL